VLAALAVAGCSVAANKQPIYQINNENITVISEELPIARVEQAIVKAGVVTGWRISKLSQGLMLGTMTQKSATAMIEISYNTQSYSIRYRDSANMGYDGAVINPIYNTWVEQLNSAIQTNLIPRQ
jgi:hypothetical protein